MAWKHSGFNIHRSERVPPGYREDMERLAQYIVRNPFSVEKMQPDSSGDSIIYRSGMNPKLGRNFEVLSPCDFIARITQHIPGKSFQLVRYYGWYPNKMRGQVRGQRLKREDAETGAMPAEGAVIEISEPKPRRIPSKKWRELIKKVWEAAGRLTLKARSGSVWACKSPLPASNSGPTPRRAESDFLSENHSL